MEKDGVWYCPVHYGIEVDSPGEMAEIKGKSKYKDCDFREFHEDWSTDSDVKNIDLVGKRVFSKIELKWDEGERVEPGFTGEIVEEDGSVFFWIDGEDKKECAWRLRLDPDAEAHFGISEDER